MNPQKIDDIISTLPTENGWLSDDNYPIYNYEGFWYSRVWIRGAIAAQARSQPAQATDIILACNSKCGTTWLKALSFAIITRTYFTRDKNPLRFTNPHDLIRFLEAPASTNIKTLEPNLPLISTHLPYTNLPNSVLALECKIVYICRDPKDTFISRWHFSHKMCPNKDVTKPIPLEEAFDLFCRWVSSSGPYWDHVLGYWKAFLDRPDNVLFLKYEDMMSDAEEHVKRLAEFMGYPFSTEEEKEGVVERIVEMCSFQSLSNMSVNKGDEHLSNGSICVTKDSFFRKAKVGDWKNYLTREMKNRIDQITIEKLGAYGLTL